MITNVHFPEKLSGILLDKYLANGWYRMGQIVFTTDQIEFENAEFPVYWLRYHVPDFVLSRSHRRIMGMNEQFTVEIKPFILNEELERLYSAYKEKISFDPSPSVESFMFDSVRSDVYDTTIIEIREEGKLIAAGILDNGGDSFAGIMNFYHPGYSKYSLGKYLMLLKMIYAGKKGLSWYYPGYIMGGNTRFDYKLFLSRSIAEIFLFDEQKWVSYEKYWPLLKH